jgi:RNA polymerase sigma-70 factor (ECF subfamily)
MDKSQKQQLNNLLLDSKNGNLDALDQIYELTNSAVFSVALSVVHNSEEAKDIMMSTYLRVREKINYYTPNTNGYAWVLTMAKNLSINENKKINRSTPTDFQENEFVATSQDVDCDIPVFKIAKRVLTAEELTIVLLYSVNGYKHREIAKILDKPLGTVLWSYNNSLKKIKKAIGGLK